MTDKRLIHYINHTDRLNEASIFDLTLLADKYPYFQTAQLLRVKNLHNISPESIKPVLNFTATYVTNRKVLYYLLHPIASSNSISTAKSVEKDIKDSLEENISDTLSQQVNISNDNTDAEIEFSTSFDVKKEYGKNVELKEYVVRISEDGPELMELIPNKEEEKANIPLETVAESTADLITLINKGSTVGLPIESDHLSDNQKKHNELIENFITLNPKIVPVVSAQKNKDVSEESVQENEHYLTDTLAQIYLKQGNYAKAIFAYEKLSLKFPEKSTYFADQIDEIKKLLDKKK